MTSIDPDALKRLVQDHDVDPDYDLQLNLSSAGRVYELLSVPPRLSDQKNQLIELAGEAEKLVTAINKFNEALTGFDSIPRNPADDVRFGLRRDVEKQKEQVKQNAIGWGESANAALAEIGKLKRGGGDPAFNALLGLLIDVYADSTGNKPAYPSTDQVRGTRGGPMFRFICDCLDILGVDKKTNEALGSAINRILKRRKQ